MEGFAVDIALDGEEGCHLAEIHAYDIIILDLNLPDRDGLDVLQHIRHLSKQIRVLILTALSDTSSRVKGLNLGADDYLGKPFDFEELKARIRALLRRDLLRESPLLTYGPIELNPITMTATCAGQQLTLTRKEFALLQYFYLILIELSRPKNWLNMCGISMRTLFPIPSGYILRLCVVR